MNGIELPPPSKVSLLNCGVFGYGFDAQLTIIQPTSTHQLISLINFTSLFNGCLFPRGKEEKKNGQTNQMKLIKLIEFVVGAAERPPAYNPLIQ